MRIKILFNYVKYLSELSFVCRASFQVKDESDSPGVDFNEYVDHSESSDSSEEDFNCIDD